MNIRAILFAATFLAAAPAFGQQVYQPIPNPLFTLGTTPVAPGASVSATGTGAVVLATSPTISGATLSGTTTASGVDATGTVRTSHGFTVSALPAAGTAGRRAYVTDATTCTFGGALTGGGTTVCPVFDTGTAWVAE
jgi:hypothetical protein